MRRKNTTILLYLIYTILILSIIYIYINNFNINENFQLNNKKNYKCVILIIDHSHILKDSTTNEYRRVYAFKNVWKKYINSDPDILGLFICADETLKNGQYRFDINNNTLYTAGKECLEPCILEKTLFAMKYTVEHYNFDYLLRTNISTFFVLPKLKKSFELLAKTNIFKGPILTPTIVHGCNLLFSKDIIEKLISDIPSILNKCKKIDDHCITEEIISYNIPIIDCPYYEFVINNFESIDDKIKENDTDNMYCFRNKNYKGNTDTEGTNKDIAIINKLYDYFYRL
jgi:hypothetical protein